MARSVDIQAFTREGDTKPDYRHWYAYTCATHQWATGWDLQFIVLDHDAAQHAIAGGCAPYMIRVTRDGVSKPDAYEPPKPKVPKANEVDYFGVCLYGCHGTKAARTPYRATLWIEKHVAATGHACQLQFIDHRRDEAIRRIQVMDKPGAVQGVLI